MVNIPVICLIFVLLVFPFYWRLTRLGQNLWLIATSLALYGWIDWRFPCLLLFSALVSFSCGNKIAAASSPKQRKAWLLGALSINLGLLGYLKYVNFFVGSFVALTNSVGWHVSAASVHVLLPVGISFFTFQSLTYPLDLYLGRAKERVPFITFITYVTFLPKLFAGPIARAGEFSEALSHKRQFRIEDLQEGCTRFLTGYFKKIIIADNLAAYLVNPVIADPNSYSTGAVWAAMFGYAVQVYADFSGYSSMAIGSAKVLGLTIPENFNFPFLAVNFSDFWRRWHITMSTFFRDYVYFPLGGSRKGRARASINVIATMVVCGLWHGAAWTFVTFGLIHGLYLAMNQWTKHISDFKGRYRQLRVILSWSCTQVLICLSMVPFFSVSLAAAVVYLRALFGSPGSLSIPSQTAALFCFLAFFFDHFYGWLLAHRPGFEKRYITVQATAYASIIILSYLFTPDKPNPFIYFQF
jgi:D-alanyl-lipoteichoic acid acyltransferase DltB (MBOAT superfamily)